MGSMLCVGKKCDKCGRKSKRLVAASDVCDHDLCVICYTSMVLTSDRRCQRLGVDFYLSCELCMEECKLGKEDGVL